MAKNRSKLWIDVKADAKQAITELRELSHQTQETARDLQQLRASGSGQGIFGRFRGGRNRGVGLPTPDEAARRPGFTGFLGPGAFGPLGAAMGSFQVGGPAGMAIIGGLVALTGLTTAFIAASEATKELSEKFMDLNANFPELARVFNVRDADKFINTAKQIEEAFGGESAQRYLQLVMVANGSNAELIRQLIQSGGKDILAADKFSRDTAELGILFQEFRREFGDLLGESAKEFANVFQSGANVIEVAMQKGLGWGSVGGVATKTNLPEILMEARKIRQLQREQMVEMTQQAKKRAKVNIIHMENALQLEKARQEKADEVVAEAEKEERAANRKEKLEEEVRRKNANWLREMEAVNAKQRAERDRYRAMFGLGPALDINAGDNKKIIGQFIKAFGFPFGLAIGAAAASGEDISAIFADRKITKQIEGFQSQTLNSAAEVYRRINEAANSIPAQQLDELIKQTGQLDLLIKGVGQMIPGGML